MLYTLCRFNETFSKSARTLVLWLWVRERERKERERRGSNIIWGWWTFLFSLWWISSGADRKSHREWKKYSYFSDSVEKDLPLRICWWRMRRKSLMKLWGKKAQSSSQYAEKKRFTSSVFSRSCCFVSSCLADCRSGLLIAVIDTEESGAGCQKPQRKKGGEDPQSVCRQSEVNTSRPSLVCTASRWNCSDSEKVPACGVLGLKITIIFNERKKKTLRKTNRLH